MTTKVVSSDPAHGDMYGVVFSGYSGFFYQENRLPRYNWNIVESGVKHRGPNPKHAGIFDWMFCDTASLDRIKKLLRRYCSSAYLTYLSSLVYMF